jgi:hypothetical protein
MKELLRKIKMRLPVSREIFMKTGSWVTSKVINMGREIHQNFDNCMSSIQSIKDQHEELKAEIGDEFENLTLAVEDDVAERKKTRSELFELYSETLQNISQILTYIENQFTEANPPKAEEGATFNEWLVSSVDVDSSELDNMQYVYTLQKDGKEVQVTELSKKAIEEALEPSTD